MWWEQNFHFSSDLSSIEKFTWWITQTEWVHLYCINSSCTADCHRSYGSHRCVIGVVRAMGATGDPEDNRSHRNYSWFVVLDGRLKSLGTFQARRLVGR